MENPERRDEARRRALERVSDGVVSFDADLRYTYVNQRAETLLDRTEAELLGEHVWDVFPEAADSRVGDKLDEARETGEQVTFERYNEVLDRWFEVRVYPDDNGLSLFFTDITHRRERELELQGTKQRLEAIVDAAPDPVIMIDEEFRVTRWNQAAQRVFGWSADEVKGERVPFVPEQKEAEFEEFVARLDDGEQNRSVETTRRTKDGERIEVSLSSARIETGDGSVEYLGLFKDISDRKEHERRIRSLNDATRRFLDMESKQAVASATVEAADDLLDFPVPSVWFPDESGEALELVANSDEHQQLLEAAGTTSPTHERGDWLWDVFEDGEPVVRDSLSQAEMAADLPLYSAVIVPLGEHGLLSCATRGDSDLHEEVVTLATILGRNVTAALDARDREARLEEQRDNLEVLDRMVRHDIRNDLQIVTGYAEALVATLDGSEQEHAEKILSSADTAVELTKTAGDLAEVMVQSGTDTEPVALRAMLESQLDEVRAANSSATVVTDGTIPAVSVAANEMLASVFRNLLTNAILHNDTEVPEVVVSTAERDESVVVRVADNGPGIPDAQKEAIFGKGEKNLESGGTGIGLYLVRTLVETYGGDVWVEDNDPEGAVFVVELPKSD